jgi:isochorismate pyruvate lyase
MTKLNNINDIRIEIDKIDLKILNLLSERKDLVTQVIKFKNRNQIVDQKRIDEIFVRLDKEAKKRGISQILVRSLWKTMIDSFISYEEEIFDKTQK